MPNALLPRGALLRLGVVVAIAACLFAPRLARAQEAAQFPCGALAEAKRIAGANGSGWIEVTPAQWNFLRGVFVEAPDTPASLPPGDRAALSRHPDGSATVIFIDGERACAPIRLQAALVAMLMAVGRGDVAHSGQGL